MSQTLVVAFAPLRSCLVNLPGRWAAALAAQPASKECMVFRLSWGAASSAYVGWSGGVSSGGAGSLEIDAVFGRQLGLADGARVGVSYVADVAT
ncbi:Peroxisome biosynthesis protein pex1, partial [Coemansia sp. RSA 2424]